MEKIIGLLTAILLCLNAQANESKETNYLKCAERGGLLFAYMVKSDDGQWFGRVKSTPFLVEPNGWTDIQKLEGKTESFESHSHIMYRFAFSSPQLEIYASEYFDDALGIPMNMTGKLRMAYSNGITNSVKIDCDYLENFDDFASEKISELIKAARN